MSDWRDSEFDEPQRERKRQEAKRRAKHRAANRPAGPPAGSTAGPSNAASKERLWLNDDDVAESISPSVLKKWGGIGVLALVAAVLFAVLLWSLRTSKPLQIRMHVAEQYDAPELGENPFGARHREWLNSAQSEDTNFVVVDEGDDQPLAQLGRPEWIESLEASGLLSGSGPAERLTPFYISCFAVLPTGDNDILLLTGTEDRFVDQVQQALELSELCRVLASKVPPGRLAWLVLDLQLPPVYAKLSDLSPAWKTAAERALSKLNGDLRQRVLVTLPCNDLQQNWLAPEYACSFFAHHFRSLITGEFRRDGIFDDTLTLTTFRNELAQRVGHEVWNRRSAQQEPVWLPESNLEALESLELVTIGDTGAESKNVFEDASERLRSADLLWEKLKKGPEFANAYRRDPLGYATVESRLLALEYAALYQPDGYAQALVVAEQAFDAIAASENRAYGVSLLEDQEREVAADAADSRALVELAGRRVDEYLSPNGKPQFLFGETGESTAAGAPAVARPDLGGPADDTPASGNPAAGNAAAGNQVADNAATDNAAAGNPVSSDPGTSPPLEATLGQRERALFAWQFLVELAQRPDSTERTQAFTEQRLAAIAQYVGNQSNWVETALLRRLQQNIDWDKQDPWLPTGVAKVIQGFDALQRIGSTPEPELAWLLREELANAEAEFLNGFDSLMVGDAVSAFDAFASLDIKLVDLAERRDTYVKALRLTRDSLYATPHLLNWMVREYQIAADGAERQQLEGDLKQLAELVNLAGEGHQAIYQASAGGTPDPVKQERLDKITQELGSRYDSFLWKFRDYVRRRTSVEPGASASAHAQTFRRDLLALSSPLLAIEQRKKLHAAVNQYLSPNRSSEEVELQGATGQNERLEQATRREADVRPILRDHFLTELNPDWRSDWEQLLNTDMRLTLKQAFKQIENTADIDAQQLHRLLLMQEIRHRTVAHALGSAPSVIDIAAGTLDASPWSAARARMQLSEASRRLWQCERLSNAGWGNGVVSPGPIYFELVADAYTAIPKTSVRFPQLEAVTNRMQTQMQSSVNERAALLRSLQIKVGGDEVLEPQRETTVTVSKSAPWDALANAYLGTPGERRPWKAADRSSRALPIDLREVGPQTFQVALDLGQWGESGDLPPATLSVRGNRLTRRLSLKLPSQANRRELELVNAEQEASRILVRRSGSPPAVRVILLIDCSESMRFDPPGTDTPSVMKLVQMTANRILEDLLAIDKQGIAEIYVGVAPFGLKSGDGVFTTQLAQLCEEDPLLKQVYTAKPVQRMTQTWSNTLKGGIDSMQPSGQTPLYESIIQATERTGVGSSKTLLLVLGDGMQFYDQHSETTTRDTVLGQLAKLPNVSVKFFLFDFFNLWLVDKIERDVLTWKGEQQDIWRESLISAAEQRKREADYRVKVRELYTSHKASGLGDLRNLQTRLGADRFSTIAATSPEAVAKRVRAAFPSIKVGLQAVAGEDVQGFAPVEVELGQQLPIDRSYLPGQFELTVGASDADASKQRFQLAGGEWLVFTTDGITFENSQSAESIRAGLLEPTGVRGDGLAGDAYLLLRRNLLQFGSFAFDAHFSNGSAYTPRPKFMVAEAIALDRRDAFPFVLPAYSFLARQPYPVAQFCELPWQQQQRMRLRLWAAQAIPQALESRVLEPEKRPPPSLDFGKATVSFQHFGPRVEVRVDYQQAPRPDERLFVSCPDFERAVVEFDDDLRAETKYTYHLRTPDQSLQVTVGSIRQLETAARDGQCKQFTFDNVEL